jgi:hypothetical protein
MLKVKEPTYKLMVNSTNLLGSPIVKCDCRMLIYKHLVSVPCQIRYCPGIYLVERKDIKKNFIH